MASDIVLATLNARYTHASLGLRYLRANLGAYRERAEIVEGTLDVRPLDFVERLLEGAPRIVGLGVYIWNAQLSLEVVRLLRQVAPDVVVVVGGPEVSHEVEAQEICELSHHVVRGEGEVAFRELCRAILDPRPLDEVPAKVRDGGTPELAELALPFDEYTEEDLRRRAIYVEASRGCPFRCAFCLSALDKQVRPFPLDALLEGLDGLYRRGLRRFRFVDRTFNLAIDDAVAILRFFRERSGEEPLEDLFLHFEMIPDRLPDELLAELALFPPGVVQLEVGLQTFDPDVARAIQRRTDFEKAVANIRALREHTGVHIHADLIAGLPGETWEGFARGFDALEAAGPQEIQLGILKRLRGAPLTELPEAAAIVFERTPPYEVLHTPTLSFGQLMELRRVARVWDRVFNEGRFVQSASLLLERWRDAGSVFEGLSRLARAVHAEEGALHGISLLRWAEHVHRALLDAGLAAEVSAEAIRDDYCEGDRRRPPPFLDPRPERPAPAIGGKGPPERQRRHLAGGTTSVPAADVVRKGDAQEGEG
jgi:radical SAM superfamily enzyme YgiQ (UPF0313 family)